MKIALINLSLDTNYGGNLQRFALYTVLTNMGYDVTYIPYIRKNHKPTGLHKVLSKAKRFVYKYILRKVILVNGNIPVEQYERDLEREYELQMPNFIKFTKEHVKCWPKSYQDFDSMKEIVSSFDTFIVGSDQVWRAYSKKTILHFYLDFVPKDKRKIAYAASFGNYGEGYNPKLIDKTRKLIKEFKAVSFREQSGLDLASKFKWEIQTKPQLALDPTLLLHKEDYLKLTKETPKEEDKYLFYYVLDWNDDIKRFIKKASKELHLDIKGIKSIRPNVGRNTSIMLPTPEEWLRKICGADFVITDSFHGTLFSIMFNKPFVTIINKSRGAERYNPLLKDLNLKSRIFAGDYLTNLTVKSLEPIDWNMVNSNLNIKRKTSCEFLKVSLA